MVGNRNGSMKGVFACPSCKRPFGADQGTGDVVLCSPCNLRFPIIDGVPCFMLSNPEAEHRSAFWDGGWKKRFYAADGDHQHIGRADGEELQRQVNENIALLKRQRSMIVTDVTPDVVAGKRVLNIGCGVGMEGPILTEYGAQYIGVDFSFTAAKTTADNLRKLRRADYTTAQADAENLPISDESIDIVFSNGVLHHTPNTQKTFDEVYRVLRLGGMAYLGLYSTYSASHFFPKLLFTPKALLRGGGWYEYTEGSWITGSRRNPWTRTYTVGKLRGMLKKYNYAHISMHKIGNARHGIPYVSHLVRYSIFEELGVRLGSVLGGMIVSHVRK
jgi:SAM-dependent methyltransferase/uncharacterized protein YbaR (Trm112 family)